jgi:hypothetical protein
MSRYLERLEVQNNALLQGLKNFPATLTPQDKGDQMSISDLVTIAESEKKLIKKAKKRAQRDKEKNKESRLDLLKEIDMIKSRENWLSHQLVQKNSVASNKEFYHQMNVKIEGGKSALDILNDMLRDQYAHFKLLRKHSPKFVIPTQLGYERDRPLTLEEWEKSLDPKGRIYDSNAIKQRIFFGGVSPELRPIVWKFLLNYFPWNSTLVERQQISEQKRICRNETTMAKFHQRSTKPFSRTC